MIGVAMPRRGEWSEKMIERTKSATGRILSELYHDDQRRREEPPEAADERARRESHEHEEEGRHGERAA
jgi:hypothetical protein